MWEVTFETLGIQNYLYPFLSFMLRGLELVGRLFLRLHSPRAIVQQAPPDDSDQVCGPY